MGLGEERELVPLGPGFDITKRGYHTAQVNEHLERMEAELQLLHADRNAAVAQAADLAKQLEHSRTEIGDLRKQVDRLSLPPTTLEGLSERLQRMLRLAQEEAAETKARAEAEAGHIRAKAEADGAELRQRYERMLADLEKRRAEMEAEHREVLAKARAEAEHTVAEARAEAERLDAAAQRRREQVEEDFEIAMSGRRTEAMRALAEQEATSKSEAERRVREATEEANRRRHEAITEAKARLEEATSEAHRRVREATDESNRRISHAAQRVAALRQLRARVADQLNAARNLIADAHVQLADAAPALDPLPEERVPTTVDGSPADNSPTRTMLTPVKPASETSGPPRESWEPKDPDGGQTQVMAVPDAAKDDGEKTKKSAPVKSPRR
ncbi:MULTISPECIES: chromosome segregation protein [Actinokineospora]|uniref:Chromosome segregation protein n=1 Tax=Actinokineospora fastidiosa TaxID=1816 RepID=A0A918LHS9_9PSEU|nr:MULTISPECIES: chromosome segregation protein [Actinokineospora]UVS81331.1 chromosome segregation protein SMC [Actinokineospora sp. UTMC 2448]GGS52946.1 chromosome segregation protein [Actinokineospora fastidiosa]